MKAINRYNRMFLVLATMVLLFAATALAQGAGEKGRKGRGQRGPESRLEMLTEKLELSEEQTAAIGEIMAAGQEKSVAIRKETMRLRNELEGEMLKDEPSESTALALVKKIGDLRTEAQSNRMQNRLAVREQLTPEQQDKMLMMKSRSGKGHGRRGGHGKGARFGGGKCDSEGRPECDGEGPHGGRGGGKDQ